MLIERIFSYPGIGNMAIGAVIDRDLPLIQGTDHHLCDHLHFLQPADRSELSPAQPKSCPMNRRGRRFGNLSSSHVRVWLGGSVVLLMVIAAVFAPWIAPHDPLEQDLISGLLPPFWSSDYNSTYLFGNRQPGKGSSVKADLWCENCTDCRHRRSHTCRCAWYGSGFAGRLLWRTVRYHHFPHGGCLDVIPSGSSVDHTGRRDR